MQPRIIGGEPSDGDWPSMVSLHDSTAYERTNAQRSHVCGGTLISARWVLTAAHCVTYNNDNRLLDPSLLLVLAGDSPRDEASENGPIGISRILIYPSFDPFTFEHDIALLELALPVIEPMVPVASSEQTAQLSDGSAVRVLGWGTTTRNDSRAEADLQQVDLGFVSQDECGRRMGSGAITDTMLCAYAEAKDACLGDSGGPLLAQYDDNWHQVGIVSWGFGCASEYPGVYTRVSAYLGWIQSMINGEPYVISEPDTKQRLDTLGGIGSMGPASLFLLMLLTFVARGPKMLRSNH